MRVLKVTVAITGAALILAALYVIIGNVLLVRGTVERMASKEPERFRLAYTRASTSLPGRVHVQGLDLRGRDEKVEWQLHVDDAEASLSLWDLMSRHLRVRWATVRGVTFRLRFRLEPANVDDDRISRIPAIEGFDQVPLRTSPPLPPQDKPPFTIEVAHVDAQAVREVWIDGFRLRGDLALAGGFTLGPEAHLELLPSSAQVEHASLTTGEDPIVTEVKGNLDARIEPVDLHENGGALMLRYLTTHSTFRGHVGGVRFLRHFVDVEGPDQAASDNSDAFSGGAGTFDGTLALTRGLVDVGSRSHLELEPARVRFAGRSLTVRARIDTGARSDDGGLVGEAKAALSELSFVERDGKTPAITGDGMTLFAHAPATDLAELPRDVGYGWDAPHLQVRDLHALDAYLPTDSPFRLNSGPLAIASHGDGSREALTVTGTIAGNPNFRAFGAGVTTLLDGAFHLQWRFAEGTLDLGGSTVTLRDPAINGSNPDRGWTGRVTLPRAVVTTDPAHATREAPAPSFQATFDTSCRDARPLLAFFGAMQGRSPVVGTALSLIPEPLVDALTRDLHGGTALRASKGELVVHQLAMKGASSALHAEVEKHEGQTTGGLLLEAGPTSFGIGFTGDGATPVLLDAPGWYAREVAHNP